MKIADLNMPFFFDNLDDDSEAGYQTWRWENECIEEWDEEEYESTIIFKINE